MPLPSRPRAPAPLVPRTTDCRCGRPVFFRNSTCLACGTALGYDPQRALLLPLAPAPGTTGTPDADGLWVPATGRRRAQRYRRCANLDTAAGCNWLLDATERGQTQCRCCRLNRTLPDLSVAENQAWWGRIAVAQRRLVSLLIALGLPARPPGDDPQLGLAFDLLRQLPGAPPVVTGHADGLITLDVAEADDAQREQRRTQLQEPYRTLLGHLRHESGHYYWQRLVADSAWLAPVRALFGDDRLSYAEALQRHYAEGAPADWQQHHVSAYASSHPWEDWAETWAHYLHLVDTLDTARGFGLDGDGVELHYERWTAAALETDPADPAVQRFLDLVNGWMELTGVLNELSRSMGLADFYPFVLSRTALRKLHLVDRIVQAPRPGGAAASGPVAAQATRSTRGGEPASRGSGIGVDRVFSPFGDGDAAEDGPVEDEAADPVGDGHSDAALARHLGHRPGHPNPEPDPPGDEAPMPAQRAAVPADAAHAPPAPARRSAPPR